MSNSNPHTAMAPTPAWLRWLLPLAVLAWVIFQASNATTAAAGSDSSGYLNSARQFTEGRLMTPQRIPTELGTAFEPTHFMPLGFWTTNTPGQFAPTYPPGLPLHFAAASLLLGWKWGPLCVIVAGATTGLLLLYQCARELGVSAGLAAAGAVMLATCPVFISNAIHPLSDVLAMTWCTAAVWTALRARRGGPGWAWATGAAFALAVLVRPSNTLLLPCLLVLLGDWRRWVAAAIAGLPGALWFGYLNQVLNGSPFRTGYGDILSSLSSEWLMPTLGFYARWLPMVLPALVLVLPFAVLWQWRGRVRVLLALALWWFAFAGFYAFYGITHEVWWCLRFLLPAFPALLLGALLGAETLLARPFMRAAWWRPAVAALLILWAFASCNYWLRNHHLLYFTRFEIAYHDACRWARTNLPANAVIATFAASGSVYFYNENPVLRWDSITAEQFKRYAAQLRGGNRPVYAMLFSGEEDRALRENMPDRWEKIGEESGITFWKLAATP